MGVFCISDTPKHSVFTNECAVYMPPDIPEQHASTIGALVQWIVEKPPSIEKEAPSIVSARLHTSDSGFEMHDKGYSPRIYVPVERRRYLFDFTHKSINHLAANPTYTESSKSYFWPTTCVRIHARGITYVNVVIF